MSNTIQTLGDEAAALASAAAQSTDQAIRATQRTAQQGMDQLSARLGDAKAQAGNTLEHLMSNAESLGHRSMDAVHDGAGQIRAKSQHMRDATVSYIQHEPIKSMLMAAATGAALMGMIALFSRHGSNGR
ncbi:MAG: hypothetical protein LT081_01155 [Hydrogenophaga sp.]|jgi:ElaB/YqjD/DUF883 family membrane-anchored ribosome-binding protein|nr:hypothetical protein [Hydrogenophaga sp.]MDI3510941.1 hypothetical protein [Betaproteobacteria bacterium]